MRVLSWNINSLRLRLPLLAKLIRDQQPDVICLQETKVQDHDFPRDWFAEQGYPHLLAAGIKSYNGVAIASRWPLEQPMRHARCGREDARHVSAVVAGIQLHNLYVPAGGDIPDPVANPKFAHKLEFYAELAEFFASQNTDQKLMLVGDLNVAPLPEDVWNHRQLLAVVCHTPVEVAAYTKLQQAVGGVDAVRQLTPAPAPLFSWWSYRAHDWAASNRGRRIDHAWLSPDLVPQLRRAEILREQRGQQPALPPPSDHVPLLVELAL
jgi:exodeoxyribonuclease-3